jgi:hypothetical protein
MKTLSEETEEQITWGAYGLYLTGLTERPDFDFIDEQLAENKESFGYNERGDVDDDTVCWYLWEPFEEGKPSDILALIEDAKSQLRSLAHFAIKHG